MATEKEFAGVPDEKEKKKLDGIIATTSLSNQVTDPPCSTDQVCRYGAHIQDIYRCGDTLIRGSQSEDMQQEAVEVGECLVSKKCCVGGTLTKLDSDRCNEQIQH